MRLLATAAAAVLTIGLTACNQSETSVSNNVAGTPDGGVDEPGVANMADNVVGATSAGAEAYVTAAAASDMFEIETSKLAQQKGQSGAVKSYAKMMIDEHTKSSTELKAAVQGISPAPAIPTVLPADKQTKVDALKTLSGAAFDRQYLADQQAGHQETLAKVNSFLASAQSGPLKDHASKTTGVVQKHLNELQKINK
ncbi:DUF4142 domain-containing protein [Sphingomonas sp. GCM10030256]|uniref:DUF4142 domain-containing protein n=1 Tax=Sphingomonas sp. GCM10030256 TaxID=3273427 RepID=UPI003612D644